MIWSFVRPSVMKRASCMGSEKWQILPFISHFSPSPLTFPLLFTPQLSLFSSYFSPLNCHFPLSHFSFQLSLSPYTFHLSTLTFPSHISPFNSHFLLSLFSLQLSLCPLTFHPTTLFSLSLLTPHVTE